jgi:prepilin-type N-terminal cleavage/methylation domain-containing protein
MKTNMNPVRNAECGMRSKKAVSDAKFFRTPHSALRTARAFTLIELLTVIAIMALLAAFTFPVLTAVKRQQYLRTARAELDEITTALQRYHDKYGVYPPSNPYLNPAVNTLYYELSGATNDLASGNYITLDGASAIGTKAYGNAFKTASPAFSIGGIINCSKGGGEDGITARDFLPNLRQNRIGTSATTGLSISNLITSVRGPDASYMPLGVQDLNPFRYLYPGTNNPNSFDLWIDLKISGKTNRICNWKIAPFIL